MRKIYCWLEKMINTKISFELKVKVEWFENQNKLEDQLENWHYKFLVTIKYNIWFTDGIENFTIRCLNSKLDKDTNKWIKQEIYNKILYSDLLELQDTFIYLWE